MRGRRQVYSSCYDHTLRVQHFEGSGISEEVLDARQFDTDDPMLHSFDFDLTGNELWGAFLSFFRSYARGVRADGATRSCSGRPWRRLDLARPAHGQGQGKAVEH